MPRTTEILVEYFDTTIKDLIRSYEQKGLRASGKYAKSLKRDIRTTGTKTVAKITGASHIWYLQHGRGPNRDQSASQARSLGKILEQWVLDKGIDVNPYAAAWKIVREGIQVPNRFNPGDVVSDVINSEWLQEVADLLHFDVIETATSQVLTEFKK